MLCECHGVEMLFHKRAPTGRGKGWWQCRVAERERHRALYRKNKAVHQAAGVARRERLRAEGLCVACGQDVAVTGTLCFTCAGKRDMWNAARIS